jgi:hypothetical protein
MAKEMVGAKLETELIERIEEYQEEHEIETQSEALRQLVREGLDRDTSRRLNLRVGAYVILFAGIFGLANSVTSFVRFDVGQGGVLALHATLVGFLGMYVWGWVRA